MIRAPGGRGRKQGTSVNASPMNGGAANIQFPVEVVNKRRQRRGEVTNAVRDDTIGMITPFAKNVKIV